MSLLRDELLADIRSHREQFESAGDRAEELRTLPHDAVATLRELGLFWLKAPAELGGTPLPPVEFSEVIEELAYIDASTAWAAMIGAGCNGLAGGWLPDGRGAADLRRLPPTRRRARERGRDWNGIGTMAVARAGFPCWPASLPRAARHPGGGRVPGPRPLGVLQRHRAGGLGDRRVQVRRRRCRAGRAGRGATRRRRPESARMMVFAIPKAEAEVIDNWHVAGLQGTGSLDFSVDGIFVPAELTYELGSPAVRGGDLFRLGFPAFVSNEVPPLAIGLARRAIDDITELAAHTARFPGGPTVSERAVFHHALGRAEVRVRAARAVHREAMAVAFASAVADGAPSEEQQLAVTTASVHAVETCADVVSELFKFGGGRALALTNPMQRHLRNVLAARQHVALSEENYEAAGRYLLESAKARRS